MKSNLASQSTSNLRSGWNLEMKRQSNQPRSANVMISEVLPKKSSSTLGSMVVVSMSWEVAAVDPVVDVVPVSPSSDCSALMSVSRMKSRDGTLDTLGLAWRPSFTRICLLMDSMRTESADRRSVSVMDAGGGWHDGHNLRGAAALDTSSPRRCRLDGKSDDVGKA